MPAADRGSPRALLPGYPYADPDDALTDDPLVRARLRATQDLVRPIDEAIRKIGATHSKLGEQVGLSPSAVSRILNGTHWPVADHLKMIAKVLNLDVEVTKGGQRLEDDEQALDRAEKRRWDAEENVRRASANAIVDRLLDDERLRSEVLRQLGQRGWVLTRRPGR